MHFKATVQQSLVQYMMHIHIHDLWDSVVSTVTCCGLDVWEIKSQWDEIFCPILTNAEALLASCTMVPGLSCNKAVQTWCSPSTSF